MAKKLTDHIYNQKLDLKHYGSSTCQKQKNNDNTRK